MIATPALLLLLAQAPEFTYQVVRTFPHDPTSFTQGLEYRDGVLYEGTGLNGQSRLRRVKLETGEVQQQRIVPEEFFGEGITVLRNQIFQLTYTTQVGFVYDKATFKPLRQFRYSGEGWGLTNDGTRVYMSDGSSEIRVWEGDQLKETRRIKVRDAGREVRNLNELEWIKGEIWANIWQADRIARISPLDGRVIGWIDLSGLLPARERMSADVLNGIAYDPVKDRFFVTGKLWPRIYEIKLIPRKPLR